MKKLAILIPIVLCGCTALNTTIGAYDTKIALDAKVANNNLMQQLTFGVCSVPIGAVLGNPQFIPVAKAACLPSGANSSPATILP